MSKSNFFKILLVFVMAFGILPGSSRRIVNAAEENFVTTTQSENEDSITITTEVEDENDTIPEITDSKILSERNARYEDRVNHDDVCMGGGNPNNTKKPNQDPGKEKVYWDFESDTFYPAFSEVELINKFWPKDKGEAIKHTYRTPDAVIEPDDQCFYANKENGFGESVSPSEWKPDFYFKHDKDWKQLWGEKWTPRPTGSQRNPNTGLPISPPNYNDLKYTGNYLWKNNSGGYLFTIVTRPALRVGLNGHYFDPQTGKQIGQYYIGGNSHPRVYDTTGEREWEHNPMTSMYRFNGITTNNTFYSIPGRPGYNNSTPYRKTPTIPGRYKMTVQVREDVSQFILPGIWEEEVIYMNRGYRTKFVQKVDGANEKELTETDWNDGQKPDPFDKNTKDLFGIDFYLQNKDYKIPIPKYDESKYIFEGWQVEEQYWNDYSIGYPHGHITIKTKELNANNDGTYTYRPTTIDANQYFVLEAKLIAKFRTRKTNTVNVSLNFINDNSGLSETEKATVSTSSIKLVEGINNEQEFLVSLKDKPFDFVGYGKNTDGRNPLETNVKWKPGAANSVVLPDNQLEVNKETQIYATITAKPITIKLDPNGGQVKTSSKQSESISTYYYKDTQISTDKFENKDFVLKGWSETKDGDIKVTNGGIYKVEDLKVDGKYPSEITLYAVWGVKTATVHTEKHKDSLVYSTNEVNLAAGGIYTNGGVEINAFELGRFYFDVTPADSAIKDQKNLDPTKFYVVIERSTDNGKSWQKMKLDDISDGAIITKPFGKSGGQYAKVVYDKEKGKWFAPLLGRINKMTDPTTYHGLYRINVAYDDDKAVEEVSTEQQFFNENKKNGWSQSNSIEVKIIQDASDFIKVPSSITLVEKTESTSSGEIEVIESVNSSNKVEVVPFQHVTNNNTKDYDWNTPNNALSNGNNGSYNEDLHTQFVKSKPFYVTVLWNSVLTDTSGQYKVNNIQMYSHSNVGNMTENQVIPSGTKQEFVYDGKPENKLLFDFYLKGNKPKGLPEGMTFKGTVTFQVTMNN
ncbi:hypothetical protein [Amedibacillus dolichus]|uniref:Uncharacterized protein n=1 Tax=Amedibacillus dolichus CAG:375 TaxID=1263076 RepID=R7G9T5_9FIRM|nr:hypothetical protein [Amedibacillus dolichus]CDE23731.1 putative uncharacterized protein [Amedibacillus dolichus CAG:375]